METKYSSEVINGVKCNKIESDKGTLLTKNQRSLMQEANNMGTHDVALVEHKHCFLLGENRYYTKIESLDSIIENKSKMMIQDLSTDGGKTWVPCLFQMKESANIKRGRI